MDDRAVGLVLRALRRRRGWRQSDLAARAGCSQALVSNVERGHLSAVTVNALRLLFAALDARLLLEPRWRGAAVDRLLDSEHAAIANVLAARLERDGWLAMIEVTYSVNGERGSIDMLGVDRTRRAVLVAEVKSDVPGAEAVARKLDEKRRLAARIVRERLGWTPETIGVVLVMPESNRLRRLLAGPAAILARSYPVASRLVASWLRNPVGPLAATWFLSDITARNASRVARPPRGPRARILAAGGLDLSVEPASDDPPSRILR